MKSVSILGSEHFINTLPRIKEDFESLGYMISNETPDFIFCNDPPKFEEALSLRDRINKPLILNILDMPTHVPEFKWCVDKWSHYLSKADEITSISKFTQSQVKLHTGFDSTVIYNPIKDVSYKALDRDKYFISVGRVNDPNKRFKLSASVIQTISSQVGIPKENLLNIIGTENPSFGNYRGMVNDDELDNMYNTTEIILITSKVEGICLPLIEAMICGCIPVVCEDMTTAREFAPEELIVKAEIEDIIKKIYEIMSDLPKYRSLVIKHSVNNINLFNKITVAKNIENVYHKYINERK